MVQQGGLVDGAGVVVQAPGDGQVHGEVGLGHAEGGQVGGNGLQLLKTGVEERVSAGVAFQGCQYLGVGAPDGDEGQDLARLVFRQAAVLQEDGLDLLRPDLIQLVHGAHNVAALVGQPQHIVEAGKNFPVVYPDLEAAQAEAPEDLVDDGGDLRLVEDVQLAVTDDIDIRLVKLPEPAPLGPLSPVDLADLVAAEGESQLVVVQGHIFCQRHRQIEPQSQVAVTLGEAVDLLFGLAPALGQKDLGVLNGRGV